MNSTRKCSLFVVPFRIKQNFHGLTKYVPTDLIELTGNSDREDSKVA